MAIAELSLASHRRGEAAFTLASAQKQSISAIWSHHWLAGSRQVLAYRKQDSYHWLRFPSLADFQISENATEICCYPVPETPYETIHHLLLDQVLPRCLAHQGKVMLHASAVKTEEGMLLILGDSGAGKSTLAGNFHQAGHPALADDCVWLQESKDQVRAVPSYGGLRLWSDSFDVLFAAKKDHSPMAHYSTKKRVPLDKHEMHGADHGVPVLAMIMLAPPGQLSTSEVILGRLPRREAFIAMLKETFQLDLHDLERISRHAQALGRLVSRVPAFRLSMPRDFALLPTVRQKILETIP